jgi:hypothetical protein
MSSYYFLFACAYWVSVEDLKEKSAPQEYAFIFVSVIDLLLFVSVTGAINLYMDRNILSGITVIIVSTVIASINYFVFLRGRRFQDITDKFARVSHTDFKRKRIGTMVVSFLVAGLIAISIAYANSFALR